MCLRVGATLMTSQQGIRELSIRTIESEVKINESRQQLTQDSTNSGY